jgi:competence protein ComEC
LGGALWCGALAQSAAAPWRIVFACGALILFSIISKKFRLTVLVVAIFVGATAMSLRQASLESSAIQKYFGTTVQFSGQVRTDPSKTATGNYSFIISLDAFQIDKQNFQLRVPVRIIASRQLVALPGQRISGTARVIKSKEARVAALFIVDQKIVVLTPPSRWAATLGSIRNGLRKLSGEGDAGALIPGMVLGDTSKQSAEFKDQMKRSGLTHLVAVSGANFAIVSAFVLWIMQFAFKKKSYRLIATSIALICFIGLVRPSPSVLRAASMAAVLIFAQASKRATDSLPALGFAMAAVVIGDPWQARDAGFALSVLATAGLLLLAPIIQNRLPTHKKIAGALAPPIAAMVFCSPILVALSGYLSPMSIVANLLAAPAVGPITILGFLAALFSPFAPFISSLLIGLIRIPASFITGVAHWAASFPVLTIHDGTVGFFIVAAIVMLLWLFKAHWKKATAIVVVLILSLTWLQRWPAGDWDIANCNVGQGDSMVINLGNGHGIVIDVGPDASAVNKCLKSLGIKDVPLLVLSHFHADHVGGLAGLLQSRKVGQVWISNNAEPLLESGKALAALRGTPVVTVEKGLTMQLANIKFEILWPLSTVSNFAVLPGDGSAINNSSIAMLVSSPDWTMFTGGDIEPPAQQQILASVRKVDIYKVSHHGSKYQDAALMAALSPQVGVISVGAKNSYGHPAPETIDALTRLGAQVYRTDTDGAIALTITAHQVQVRKSKAGFQLFYWS